MKSYAKDAGYDEIEAFYVEDPTTYRFKGGPLLALSWEHFLVKKIFKN
ncbi:hypothetical protein RDI58_028630 [Solanum bulbocastanum]|uniref:Uncharacterized protein n=1 Tax=Solanum bulbocastanum TaxID=147425 RepID=A0AAN8ST53_SOLBU